MADAPIVEEQQTAEELTPVVNTETNLTFTEFSWMDTANVGRLYKVANMLASGSLIPQTYRGKPQDIMIAMELANRSNMPLMAVMQNLYVVQGKPAWSGSYTISAINNCGLFKPLEFVWMRDEKTDEVTGCIAQAEVRETGKIAIGPPITWATVQGFGWEKKPGSMWNIPGQREAMYMYRAASYFARCFCPHVLNGIYTKEEVEDTWGKDN